jgi:hypothetical protein
MELPSCRWFNEIAKQRAMTIEQCRWWFLLCVMSCGRSQSPETYIYSPIYDSWSSIMINCYVKNLVPFTRVIARNFLSISTHRIFVWKKKSLDFSAYPVCDSLCSMINVLYFLDIALCLSRIMCSREQLWISQTMNTCSIHLVPFRTYEMCTFIALSLP